MHTVKSCVKCTEPCATCYGNAATCTSCISKYTLVGWKCVSTFNYGFKTTLNTTLSDFYTKYYNFLEAIAGSQQTNQINITTLLNITEGSVVVKGNITTSTTSDSNEASVQFENLTSVLSAGSIAGMDIIRSDISPNGGTVPSDSGPNLALILGICIPLAVISNLFLYFSYRTYYLLCLRSTIQVPPSQLLWEKYGTRYICQANLLNWKGQYSKNIQLRWRWLILAFYSHLFFKYINIYTHLTMEPFILQWNKNYWKEFLF